jgi:hypothetical protein
VNRRARTEAHKTALRGASILRFGPDMNRSRGDDPLNPSGPPRRPALGGSPAGRGRHMGGAGVSTSYVIAIVAVLVVGVFISACRAPAGPHSLRPPVSSNPLRQARSGQTTTTTVASTTTTTDAGSLPQTDALPSADSPQFQSMMSVLWNGIVTNSLAVAKPAFFPESAYQQLKTISYAQSDYVNRLEGDFSLDIAAAHDLLGTRASPAVLVGIDVPSQYAHWVRAGVCDNRLGYFEVANSRIVYNQDGVTRSIGIASLISWRGVWYVVHLGAILRSADAGVVEDPEIGPGHSAPSSTC